MVFASAGAARKPMKPSGRTRTAPPPGAPALAASKPRRAVDDRDEPIPARAHRVQTRRLAEHDQVMAFAFEPMAIGKAEARLGRGDGRSSLADERASGVGNVEHRPPARGRQDLVRGRRRELGRRAAGAEGVDQRHDVTVNVIRHFERMSVRHAAFDRVAREQRRLCRAAHDEGELPGDVGRVHESSVDPLPAERARHVPGVAEQKPPAVAETLGFAPMHLEIGNPAQIVQRRRRS